LTLSNIWSKKLPECGHNLSWVGNPTEQGPWFLPQLSLWAHGACGVWPPPPPYTFVIQATFTNLLFPCDIFLNFCIFSFQIARKLAPAKMRDERDTGD
jgi:hypothetical protein